MLRVIAILLFSSQKIHAPRVGGKRNRYGRRRSVPSQAASGNCHSNPIASRKIVRPHDVTLTTLLSPNR